MKNIISLFLCFLIIFNISGALASDGLKNINVFVRDEAGNIQFTPSSDSITLDTTSPVIDIINNVDSTHTNVPKVITANVSDVNLLTSQYSVVESGDNCNTLDYTKDYISGTDLVFPNENFNGKKVCFKAEDLAGNISYNESNIIENIDTTPPVNPVYNYAYQDSYNTISFKGVCTYKPGLKFIVESNGVIIHEENLSDPCNIDFNYTLSTPPLIHNIEYYLLDLAGNKTSIRKFTSYVDDVGYLITPADGVTVNPIVSFMGFTSTPNAEIKIKEIGGDYIAEGISDSKGYFILQTPQSLPLGSMQIDLEINGVLRGDIRNITIESSSIVVPTFSNEDEIKRSNTKLITAEIKGNPLSHVRMYSRGEDGNRIELGETSLDSNGKGTISSNVELPGGENIIYIQDTIYNVSSHILLIIVIDPFGYAYDSITKETIPGVKVTVTDCEGLVIDLPLLHGQPQPNPMFTDNSGYYDSYELPGTYCLEVEKEGYKWPSDIISAGTSNLDGSINIGSHGQPFVVVNDPIHIDIPMDKQLVSLGGGGGGGGSSILYSTRTSESGGKSSSSSIGMKIEVQYPKDIKTLTKTYNTSFNNASIPFGEYYRYMYHKGEEDKKEIVFNKSVDVSITDLNYKGEVILIKTIDSEDWKELENYTVNNQTINFKIDRGFILKFDYNNIKKPISANIGNDFIVIQDGIKKYPFRSFNISNIDYIKSYNKNRVFFEKLGILKNSIVVEKFPIVFSRIEEILEKTNLPLDKENLLKSLYNHMSSIYILHYENYIKNLVINN